MTTAEISNDRRYEIVITQADIEEAFIRRSLDNYVAHSIGNPLIVALRRVGVGATRTDGNFLYDKDGVIATLSSTHSLDLFNLWMRAYYAIPRSEWFRYV